MKTCYFTASGNSLYVARKIGGELISIPQLMKQNDITLEDDAVGIVCPVYCGEMPMMVRDFLDKSTIRTDYFFFVYTYGMSETVAKAHAMLAVEHMGNKLDYVSTIKMVDNYLPGFEMKNQIETAGKKKIEEHLSEICKDISERKIKRVSVGPFKKAEIAIIRSAIGKSIMDRNTAKSYIVNDNCIRCGLCAKVCPANNITVKESVEFSDRCEVCYACVHSCPKNAIHLKSEKSAERFRNEHISVMDIVTANE